MLKARWPVSQKLVRLRCRGWTRRSLPKHTGRRVVLLLLVVVVVLLLLVVLILLVVSSVPRDRLILAPGFVCLLGS